MGLENDIKTSLPVFWINPTVGDVDVNSQLPLNGKSFTAACEFWQRMQPLMVRLYPEVADNGGVESLLTPFVGLDADVPGQWLVKQDHALPVAGSIKARGGFFEVISYAWALAQLCGLVIESDPLTELMRPDIKAVLKDYRLSVGSTGNLGLSIGLIGRALGFEVEVHMSREAKTWKKDRLRAVQAKVVEHSTDYTSAVRNAGELARRDSKTYFVDDEHSQLLLLGYSAAALELHQQLEEQHIMVDAEHPLLVYLPCGIGGAPGGITFGLKQLFGEAVHCFFAEPVASPCMLVSMMYNDEVTRSVYDFGLDNKTEADGLAVGQASPLVSAMMQELLAGVYTVTDEVLLEDLRELNYLTGLLVEPSAAAGLSGPVRLMDSEAGKAYLEKVGIDGCMDSATHIVWTTGGSLVPKEQYNAWLGDNSGESTKSTGDTE